MLTSGNALLTAIWLAKLKEVAANWRIKCALG